MADDRDFFAEGVDAALAAHSDIPPADVSEFGPDAEARWNDGYNEALKSTSEPEEAMT